MQTSLQAIAEATKRVAMRKRVAAKSPVLENGTPGSVRGALGNWRPYRDGRFVDESETASPSLHERFFLS